MNSLNPLARKAIYLVLTCALLALWMLPTSTEILCSGAECQTGSKFNGQALKGDLTQTFDIQVRVSPHRGKLYIDDFTNKDNGIGLSWNRDHRLLITIPMRYGSATAFRYATPEDLEFSRIRIRIEKSESLYIFVDEKIAYSHRYENSPFFVNSLSPVNTPKRAGEVIFTASVVEQSVESKGNPFLRVGYITLILGIFAFVTVALLNRLLQGRQKTIDIKQTFGKSLYGLVGMSWVLTLLAWFRNPIDTTGAINPGPFGPIGAAFSDFYQLSQLSQFDRPWDLGGTNYPPLGILFLRLMSFYDPNNLSFFPIAGVMLGTLYFLFVSSSNKRGAGLLFFLSFPFVFGVVRGNLDLLAIFLVWISVLTWKKEKYLFAAGALAIAIALKIWPLLFLLLFLKKKNWFLFSVTVLLAFFLTISASYTLGYRNLFEIANISSSAILDQTMLGTSAFQNTFSFSSLLFIGHIALMARNPFNISQDVIDNSLAFVDGNFSSMIIVILLGTLIYLFFKTRNLANEFLILSGVVLLIPTQSFTYRALIVLLYFYLLTDIEQNASKRRSRNPTKIPHGEKAQSIFLKKITTWSAVPLFAPTAFYFMPGTQFSTASLLQPLGLLIFIGLPIYEERKSNARIE